MCSPGDTPSSLARRNDSDSHHPPPISPSPSHSHSQPTYIPPFWCCFVLISISISFSLVFVEYTSCPVTITDLIHRGPAFFAAWTLSSAVVAICSANIVVVAHCKQSALPLLPTYIFDLVLFFLTPCPGCVLAPPISSTLSRPPGSSDAARPRPNFLGNTSWSL